MSKPNKYKKARTLKELKEHPIVDEVSQEHNGSIDDLPDYWVYLVPGYCWENENSQQHQIHEYGVKSTLKEFNDSVYSCECERCLKLKS